jgi:hypothetical protein
MHKRENKGPGMIDWGLFIGLMGGGGGRGGRGSYQLSWVGLATTCFPDITYIIP